MASSEGTGVLLIGLALKGRVKSAVGSSGPSNGSVWFRDPFILSAFLADSRCPTMQRGRMTQLLAVRYPPCRSSNAKNVEFPYRRAFRVFRSQCCSGAKSSFSEIIWNGLKESLTRRRSSIATGWSLVSRILTREAFRRSSAASIVVLARFP
jgi:hypothetical protein